jgi:hypothetical protein
MIKLAELLRHTIQAEEEKGLTPVDNWKATDAMYLEDIGFKNDGIYYYSLKKPDMRLSHKKGTGFVVEDRTKKETKTFPRFKDLEEYFAKYQQRWENQPYL